MCDLFYDKYSGDLNGNGDHSYANPITSKITIDEINDGSYTYYTGEHALKLYNDMFANKISFTISECAYTHEMFKLKIYIRTKKITIIFVVIEVNINMLEKYVEQKLSIPHVDFLKILCRYHLAYSDSDNSKFYDNQSKDVKKQKNMDYIMKKTFEPVNYTFNNRIVNPSNLKINLYEYQKCSVYWMIEKEKNKKIISYNLNDEVIIGNVYYDTSTQKFNLVSIKKN